MILGYNEQDFIAYITFGLLLNFMFSIAFGVYLSKNIGIDEMVSSRGQKKHSIFASLTLIVPFMRILLVLYRVSILQFYFLNKGLTHKEFWIYMTKE